MKIHGLLLPVLLLACGEDRRGSSGGGEAATVEVYGVATWGAFQDRSGAWKSLGESTSELRSFDAQGRYSVALGPRSTDEAYPQVVFVHGTTQETTEWRLRGSRRRFGGSKIPCVVKNASANADRILINTHGDSASLRPSESQVSLGRISRNSDLVAVEIVEGIPSRWVILRDLSLPRNFPLTIDFAESTPNVAGEYSASGAYETNAAIQTRGSANMGGRDFFAATQVPPKKWFRPQKVERDDTIVFEASGDQGWMSHTYASDYTGAPHLDVNLIPELRGFRFVEGSSPVFEALTAPGFSAPILFFRLDFVAMAGGKEIRWTAYVTPGWLAGETTYRFPAHEDVPGWAGVFEKGLEWSVEVLAATHSAYPQPIEAAEGRAYGARFATPL